MRILKSSKRYAGRPYAFAVFGAWCAATAAMIAMPGFVQAQSYDIAVASMEVKESQAGTVDAGQPGKQYVVGCTFNTGFGGPSTFLVRFLVNGYAVHEVSTPIIPQAPFTAAMMAWTPVVPTNYTLACEANPDKTIPETAFTNNKKTMQFPVINPSVATQTEALEAMPSPKARVSADAATEAGAGGPPTQQRGEGEKEADGNTILVCPECFNPQPEPPGKIVEEEEPAFHPDPPPSAPEKLPPTQSPPPQPPRLEQDLKQAAMTEKAMLPSEAPGLPDLVVIVEGGKFRVKNQGGTYSPGVPLRWSCSTYGTVPLGACSWFGENGSSMDILPRLDPGEEWVHHLITSTTTQYCPAENPFLVMCKFTLAVDPSNTLTEIAETNNTGSYNLQAH